MNNITKKIYISRIKKLKKEIKNSDKLKDTVALLDMLEDSSLNTKLSYINTVIALNKYTNAFDIDLNEYKNKQYDLINKREEKLSDDIQNKNVVSYSKLIEIRDKYAKSDYAGLEHLITSLYTYIAPLRDDFGNIELITENEEDDDDNNFYNLTTKTLILNNYKGVNYIKNKNKRKKKIKFPKELDKIIKDSINLYPRNYLITKKRLKSDDLYNNYLLSGVVKDIFGGISINDIRHSFASKDLVGKGLNIENLKNDASGMQHSLPVHLTYLRGLSK